MSPPHESWAKGNGTALLAARLRSRRVVVVSAAARLRSKAALQNSKRRQFNLNESCLVIPVYGLRKAAVSGLWPRPFALEGRTSTGQPGGTC